MGRASSRKQDRATRRRGRPNLEAKLLHQSQLLDLLGGLFDAGHAVAALPLATTIRVLVHDTKKDPHSLLGQLDLLGALRFRDTAHYPDPSNMLPTHPGLVLIRMAGGDSGWVPPLGMDLPPPRIHPDAPFRPWWTTPLMKGAQGQLWSRRDMTLWLAHKEGGAHVSPELADEALRAIEEANGLEWTHHDPIRGDAPMLGGPVSASVRQVAWELRQTLDPVISRINDGQHS